MKTMNTTWIIAAMLVCEGFAHAAETITVDLNSPGRTANSRMTGFLHGMDAGSIPTNAEIAPLKPKSFRCGFAAENCPGVYARGVALGAAHVQWSLSDLTGFSAPWPGDGGSLVNNVWVGGDYTAWNTIVRNTVTTAKNVGQNFEWDIWNEPDAPHFWAQSQQQFYAAWHQGALQVKAVNPNASTVGPSMASYWNNGASIKRFLLAQKAYGTLPDVISWHEICMVLTCGGVVDAHIADMKAFLAANGISITRFSINEVTGSNETTASGSLIIYFAKMERSGVESANHSCWNDGYVDTCMTGTNVLDGILTAPTQTPARSPRQVWWANKAYADITGTLVAVTPSATVDAVAGRDSGAATVRLAVGRVGVSSIPVTVNITNLNAAPYIVSGNQVHVVAQRIPGGSKAAWSQPTNTIDANYPVSGGQISIVLTMYSADAYALKLTSPAPGAIDTAAPTVPAGLRAQAVSSSQINLTWTASTDNVGVTDYRIFRAGTPIGTATGTAFSNTGLSASTAYSYTVAAYDAAGNASAQCATASTTTPAANTVPPAKPKTLRVQ